MKRMEQFVLSDGRRLVITSLDAVSDAESLPRPFAALVPAFTQDERDQVVGLANLLIDRGCVELASIGPLCEDLHDRIDEVIGARWEEAALGVVTTWHVDLAEGCEWFLHLAGNKAPTLVAFVAVHSDVVAMLVQDVPHQTGETDA